MATSVCTDWIQLFSALLTPVIAIITTYIAFQQYKLNRFSARRELYDRRLAVYQTTMGFLAAILREAHAPRETIGIFLKETSQSHFLFRRDIPEYLESIYKMAIKLNATDTIIKAGSNKLQGEEWGKIVDQNHESFEWFTDKLDVTREKFMPYLSLNN